VHGGVVDVVLDRLPPRDVRARECLPGQQPAQLRRLRYLAHALDTLGEPCAVVPAGVAEIAVIDQQLVIETEPGQADAPA